jgi:hypothetical protein
MKKKQWLKQDRFRHLGKDLFIASVLSENLGKKKDFKVIHNAN